MPIGLSTAHARGSKINHDTATSQKMLASKTCLPMSSARVHQEKHKENKRGEKKITITYNFRLFPSRRANS